MPASKRFLKADAVAMYRSGLSSGAVAEHFGLGETTVLRWVNEEGAARTGAQTRGVTPEGVDKAIALYATGMAIAAVSAATGLGTSTIHRALVAAGTSRPLTEVTSAPDHVRQQAAALYAQGMNTYEVAAAVGYEQGSVARWMVDLGISRGYSGAQALRVALGRNKNGWGLKCHFPSEKAGEVLFCASTYELARAIQLEHDDEVIAFGRCQDRIPYGAKRHYVPDFSIECADGTRFVEEIKPSPMLCLESVVLKARAAQAYYAGRGIIYRLISECDIGQDAFDLVPFCGAEGLPRKQTKASMTATRHSIKNHFRVAAAIHQEQ